MPSAANSTQDPREQLATVTREMVDLDEQLTELAAAGKVSEMPAIAAAIGAKRHILDSVRAIVGKLDDAAATKQHAEQERVWQAEKERRQQARFKLEADYAALDREMTAAYESAEASIAQLQEAIFKAADIAISIEPLARELGHRPPTGGWRESFLRPIFYRGRYVLREEAWRWLPGLNKVLFGEDGSASGSTPLVKVVEVSK